MVMSGKEEARALPCLQHTSHSNRQKQSMGQTDQQPDRTTPTQLIQGSSAQSSFLPGQGSQCALSKRVAMATGESEHLKPGKCS